MSGVCKRRIGRAKGYLCRREALDEIGYFPLTPFTSRGVHERHYEFIDSREPNELPSPGNSHETEITSQCIIFPVALPR